VQVCCGNNLQPVARRFVQTSKEDMELP
jgi:hypothetical protein